MSYARFGWNGSDVYVYLDSGGYLTCCGCVLQEREVVEDGDSFFGFYMRPIGEIIETRFETTADLLIHLDRHRAAGHVVEESTYAELRADADENDQWIASFPS